NPLAASWRDYEVLTAPPPSSGGFAVIALLKMKDALAQAFADAEHNSAQYVHLVSEMEKRVFADRAEYLGDPDFVDVDMQALIDDAYLLRRAAEVNEETISSVETVVPGLLSPSTTHFSIVDGDGNAVSNTYTINWSYGSGVVVSGAGFLLNNEMDDFSAKAAVPNVYGVIGGRANEIEPGKRPLSSMSPTILLRDGQVEMVLGTPGGSTIFTSVFQTIVNVLDFAMSPHDAVAATRFHHQLLPADLVTMSLANPLPEDTIAALRARGYRVEPHDWEFGDVQLINRGPERWQPAADPRDRGVARVIQLEPRP
ncbi:MAG: gamma-glutamyltransferase, partial [Pseudomonadales bacterium]|nr:gamma-glutamyltransferase [Pseudomonadales bacterium]